MILTAVVATMAAGFVQTGMAWECVRPDLTAIHVRQQLRSVANCIVPQGPLAALAARQDLRDEVRIAAADGQITPREYTQIMSDACRVLCQEEMPAFEDYLNSAAQGDCPCLEGEEVTAARPKQETPIVSARSVGNPVKTVSGWMQKPWRKTASNGQMPARTRSVQDESVAPMPPALSSSRVNESEFDQGAVVLTSHAR
jgi:hypothetical protein